MKQRPFSNRDVCHLVHALSEKPIWRGTRAGRQVQLMRMQTQLGGVILWTLWVSRRPISGQAATVAEAAAALNAQLLRLPAPARARKEAAA